MEQGLVERAGIAYQGIPTGQLRGKDPLTLLRNAGKMLSGFRESLAVVRDFQPDVCLATGGYVCAPVVAACRLRGVPVLIYLPDMVPGWAIRLLSRLAQRVAVSYPEVTAYFGGTYPAGKGVVTGYPVRAELVAAVGGGRLAAADHAAHRAANRCRLAQALHLPLGVPAQLPLLLVWGGSQGSRNINEALWAILADLLPHAHILHVVGNRDWPMWQAQVAAQLQDAAIDQDLWQRYHPVAYLHEEMALALAAADVTLARAGASTLGEFPVARLPALLVPHPGVNQLQNAEYLVAHGGALLVMDQLLRQELKSLLLELLQDGAQRQQMEARLAQLAQPEAAAQIATTLYELSRASV